MLVLQSMLQLRALEHETCDYVGCRFGNVGSVIRKSSSDFVGGVAAKALALALGNKLRRRAFAALDQVSLRCIDSRQHDVFVQNFQTAAAGRC